MPSSALPPPESVTSILIWHQGALGDLLLAGPALLAVRRRYHRAQIFALGHTERWGLLATDLHLAEVWDSGESRWAELFGAGPVSSAMQDCLARFQLALVFSPASSTPVPARLQQAGIPAVHWLPSFPESGREAVGALQARRLADLGLPTEPRALRLSWPPLPESEERLKMPGPWLAVAPGSGHPAKNWPLSHYYEASRALAWEYKLRVVWLAGPAEAVLRPYLQALAEAQGQVVLAGAPLQQVAAVLSRCRLFLGNDSGLTHLAAALNGPAVVALFGPTDPRVWAPPGARVRILAGPCAQAPCARGREIPCDRSLCLEGLSVSRVLAAVGEAWAGG